MDFDHLRNSDASITGRAFFFVFEEYYEKRRLEWSPSLTSDSYWILYGPTIH